MTRSKSASAHKREKLRVLRESESLVPLLQASLDALKSARALKRAKRALRVVRDEQVHDCAGKCGRQVAAKGLFCIKCFWPRPAA